MLLLIAEDDPETAAFIMRGLDALGHRTVHAKTGREAIRLAGEMPFDIVILDRMLPEGDGLGVLKALREGGAAEGGKGPPVLMLTALGRIEDRVEGLEAGADDYLVKPFAFAELAARLNALARRGGGAEVVTRLEHGDLVMDLLKREVRRQGRPILLQPREFRLLEELVRGGDRIVTRTMLLERVWGFHFDPQTNIVETHMSRLRGKLKEGGAEDPIETVRGTGYRMRGHD